MIRSKLKITLGGILSIDALGASTPLVQVVYEVPWLGPRR